MSNKKKKREKMIIKQKHGCMTLVKTQKDVFHVFFNPVSYSIRHAQLKHVDLKHCLDQS